MSDPFLGEISMFGFNFAPMGWAFCNGQQMGVAQQTALYSLLSNIYGGNTTVFNLPNLQGRAPVCFGTFPLGGNVQIGTAAGTSAHPVTAPIAFGLTEANLPAHRHGVSGVGAETNVSVSSTTTGGQTSVPAAGSTLTNSVTGSAGMANIYLPAGTGPNTPVHLGGITTSLSGTVDATGSGAPVSTSTSFTVPPVMPPYLAVNFCIAVMGIYPSRN